MMNTRAWEIIMRDAQANYDAISMSWFDYDDDSQELRRARVQQLANRTILNLKELYESRMHEIGIEVIAKEDPDLIQTTDVDNEAEENNDE